MQFNSLTRHHVVNPMELQSQAAAFSQFFYPTGTPEQEVIAGEEMKPCRLEIAATLGIADRHSRLSC